MVTLDLFPDPVLVNFHCSTDVVHDPKPYLPRNLGRLQAPMHYSSIQSYYFWHTPNQTYVLTMRLCQG